MDIKELESFKLSDAVKFHDELNPKLWSGKNLHDDVYNALAVIAKDFITELGLSGLNVKDITISGSNAAYSYTPHSDLDLHILVDFNKLPNNEVYQELFNAKKNEYNKSHDLTIRGVPVELYVQDSNQPHVSLGEYSLLNKDWIKFPVKKKANFDQANTKAKYEKLGELIELALRSESLKDIENVLDIVKRYRKAGLTTTGEFGPENLAYKALRSKGYIQKLFDKKQELHSKKLSLEDYHPNDTPPGPEFKPTMPKGTVRVDVSDVYDWYKLGQHISNLKGLGKHDFGKGPPSTILSFGDEDLEHKYIDALKKTGLDTTDIDPKAHDTKKGQKVDPTFNVNESKQKVIEGTNCLNCKWWKKDSEKPVGKDELNGNGGLKPPNKEYIAMSKRVDLVTLPGKDTVKVKGFCYHKDINDWVTERMCCAKWDAKGVIRDYKGESPLMEVLDTSSKGIKWDTEDTDLITGKFTASNNIKYSIDILAPHIGPDELDPYDFFSDEQMTDVFYDSARFVEFEQVTKSYKGKQGIEGTGAAAEVFGIVVNGLLSYVKKYKPSMLYFQAVEPNRQKLYKAMSERIVRLLPGWQFQQKGSHFAIYNTKLLKKDKVKEASGYIPSEKEKNDPRFSTALTIDVKPDSIKKNAKAFGFKTSRAGIPADAKTNGKI